MSASNLLRHIVAVTVLILALTPAYAQTGAESSVGYIDSALPRSQVRLRYDAAYGDNRPDRAEFFYTKQGAAPFEIKDDYQDIAACLEWVFADSMSGFIEIPVRFLNAQVEPDTKGLGDMNLGFKFALMSEDDDQCLTFQFRTYIPTGDGLIGLGTDHVSLEPAFLFYQHLTDELVLESEFRDWIPVRTTGFAGNILRYGVGLSYELYRCERLRVAPVGEFVGWTVLSGKETVGNTGAILSAAGDTIVNAKMGVRVGLGERSDLYIGYGRALTGAVWYKDILRLEYRLSF